MDILEETQSDQNNTINKDMSRNSNPPDVQRQLMIKTKTCQRLQKEYEYYQKEVKENEKKLGEMKADSDKYDEYDIKRFQQVLDESFMMVPDSQKRFKNAIEDLEMFIEELKKEESSSEMAKAALEGEWYNTAQAVLQEQKKMSETEGAGFVQIQTYVDDLGDDEAF